MSYEVVSILTRKGTQLSLGDIFLCYPAMIIFFVSSKTRLVVGSKVTLLTLKLLLLCHTHSLYMKVLMSLKIATGLKNMVTL